jgi:MraZ protein
VGSEPAGYIGQGLALKSDKDRFVLPAKLRGTIFDRSDEKVLCLAIHESWPCLIGFGKDHARQIPEILEREAKDARDFGRDFNRAERELLLSDFEEVPFDNSGRFIMPSVSAELGGISDMIYFQGATSHITVWDPKTLLAQTSPVFRGPQARLRAELAHREIVL